MAKTFFYQITASLLRNIGGSLGLTLRRNFYGLAGMKMGKKAIIRENILVYRPYNVELGNNVEIGFGGVLSATEKIKIGNHVAIGPYCAIYDNSHKMPKASGGTVSKPVEIGEHSWIGTHSVILMGVKIGKNVTIGAGSIVIKNIPDNAVVMGNPARIIKYNSKINEKSRKI